MKRVRVLSVLILCALTGASAMAGTKDGGGGPSIICNGPDGKVQTAQLLDLYEGQIRYGLTVPHSSTPDQIQLVTAFNRLAAHNWFLASDVEDALVEVESKITFLPPGVIMASGVDLGDSYAAVIPNGCQLAYVGYYESDGTLRVSQDIYTLLSETDKAALFMHEALYKVARDIGQEVNSLDSRKINAYLFSSVQDLSGIDDVAVNLSWNAHWKYAGILYNLPVLVSQTQQSLTLTIDKASTDSGQVTLMCLTEEGDFETLLNNVNVGPSAGAVVSIPVQNPEVQGCHAISMDYYAGTNPNSATVTLQYGNQVIDTAKATMQPSTAYQVNDITPIYLQRQLQCPVNIPN